MTDDQQEQHERYLEKFEDEKNRNLIESNHYESYVDIEELYEMFKARLIQEIKEGVVKL